jgi:poly-gamma-glutamate synthesis protein (capsule biosynthesis protein)
MTLEPAAGVGDFNDRRSNNDTIGFPADPRICESVIAMPRVSGRKLTELKLYPISLGYKKPRVAARLADAGNAGAVEENHRRRGAVLRPVRHDHRLQGRRGIGRIGAMNSND